jgi:hypothetical protein
MQDLAAELVATLQPGRLLPSAGAPSPHEHPLCSAASRSLGPSGIDAVLHKCILGVLGVLPPPHQPLMEVRRDKHTPVACARPPGNRPPSGARARQAGLDSLGAVELRSAVCSAFGLDLAATFAFDYPTVAAMAAYITAATAPSLLGPASTAVLAVTEAAAA